MSFHIETIYRFTNSKRSDLTLLRDSTWFKPTARLGIFSALSDPYAHVSGSAIPVHGCITSSSLVRPPQNLLATPLNCLEHPLCRYIALLEFAEAGVYEYQSEYDRGRLMGSLFMG
ncbi:uncharacterized protein ARMOST_02723 [Armillaria ostoyae]|uniref:Uncharacterized protein n=1 Tax=Armillaria ostoyae TaxID=47428 RepID=A0A284QSG9_ARMOS|nr:uncharacterized protein ARMOST_02723 [Armillaria ostoyae]